MVMVRSLYDVIPTVVGASLCIRLLEFQLPSTDTQSYDDCNYDAATDNAGRAEVVRLTDLVLDLFSGTSAVINRYLKKTYNVMLYV